MPPPCAQAPVRALVLGLLPPCSGQLFTANTGAPGRCLDERLLYYFSVQREVETVALDVPRHAQADKHLDHSEDNQAGDGIIDEHDGDPDALIKELTNVSLQNARRSAVLLDREHPGQRSEERRVGKECRSRWSPY